MLCRHLLSVSLSLWVGSICPSLLQWPFLGKCSFLLNCYCQSIRMEALALASLPLLPMLPVLCPPCHLQHLTLSQKAPHCLFLLSATLFTRPLPSLPQTLVLMGPEKCRDCPPAQFSPSFHHQLTHRLCIISHSSTQSPTPSSTRGFVAFTAESKCLESGWYKVCAKYLYENWVCMAMAQLLMKFQPQDISL